MDWDGDNHCQGDGTGKECQRVRVDMKQFGVSFCVHSSCPWDSWFLLFSLVSKGLTQAVRSYLVSTLCRDNFVVMSGDRDVAGVNELRTVSMSGNKDSALLFGEVI